MSYIIIGNKCNNFKNINKLIDLFENNTRFNMSLPNKNIFGNDYYLVDCLSIKEIMETYGHTKIDLLKLDIECAENIVLEQMLNDKIYPKYLCIEFDLLLKRKDPENTTKKIVYRLQKEGYQLLVNDNLNITFKYVRNDE